MNHIDENGLRLCRAQGEIFARSLTETGCSSAVFLRRYMNSRFASRMDSEAYLYAAGTITDVFAELDAQYGKSEYGTIRYGSEELYWMGYLYRYWCLSRRLTSKQVYRMMKPADLRTLYFPYHSLDPEQAVERICETLNTGRTDDIARGVEILRRIMMKNAKPSRLS